MSIKELIVWLMLIIVLSIGVTQAHEPEASTIVIPVSVTCKAPSYLISVVKTVDDEARHKLAQETLENQDCWVSPNIINVRVSEKPIHSWLQEGKLYSVYYVTTDESGQKWYSLAFTKPKAT